jgi:hypothetical protein
VDACPTLAQFRQRRAAGLDLNVETARVGARATIAETLYGFGMDAFIGSKGQETGAGSGQFRHSRKHSAYFTPHCFPRREE